VATSSVRTRQGACLGQAKSMLSSANPSMFVDDGAVQDRKIARSPAMRDRYRLGRCEVPQTPDDNWVW